MGNQGSCTSYATSGGGIKVVGSDGRVEEYKRPIGAGELMVDNPGHFVCDSSSLHVGNRLPGLAADEELERHRCYFLLPMDMLYSVLTEEEMEVLSGKALAGVRRGAMSSKKSARRLRRRSESRVQEKPVKSGVEGGEMVWWEVSSWRTALCVRLGDSDLYALRKTNRMSAPGLTVDSTPWSSLEVAGAANSPPLSAPFHSRALSRFPLSQNCRDEH